MTTEIATFTCSICGEPSTEICVYCTKDACPNHLCERCKRCSDCCECEVHLDAAETYHEFQPKAAPREPEGLELKAVDPPAVEPEAREPERPEPVEAFESTEHAGLEEFERLHDDAPPNGAGE